MNVLFAHDMFIQKDYYIKYNTIHTRNCRSYYMYVHFVLLLPLKSFPAFLQQTNTNLTIAYNQKQAAYICPFNRTRSKCLDENKSYNDAIIRLNTKILYQNLYMFQEYLNLMESAFLSSLMYCRKPV